VVEAHGDDVSVTFPVAIVNSFDTTFPALSMYSICPDGSGLASLRLLIIVRPPDRVHCGLDVIQSIDFAGQRSAILPMRDSAGGIDDDAMPPQRTTLLEYTETGIGRRLSSSTAF
jgi:hypothetical protein